MNISGIRPQIGFYSYNNIQSTSTEPTSVEALESQQSQQVAQVQAQPQEAVSSASEQSSASQNFGAYDYAKLYRPEESFSLVGDQSKLASLDVERAVSTMRKDEVIHQYQYFVGSSAIATDSSAAIRGAEDFAL